MLQINALDLKSMNNNMRFQASVEFKDVVVRFGAGHLKVAAQFEEYLLRHIDVDTALKKITKSVYTAQLQECDAARDNAYLGMVEINKVILNRYHAPAVRAAAEKLKILFDTYGSVTRLPLNEETSAVYNIMQELDGAYAGAVREVGITAWVARLREQNNLFNTLMKERFNEAAAKPDIVMKEARGKLDDAYRAIIERIGAFIIIEGGQNYEPFVKALNVVIAKYAAALKAAKSRGKAKGGGAGTGAGTETEDENGEEEEEDVPHAAAGS